MKIIFTLALMVITYLGVVEYQTYKITGCIDDGGHPIGHIGILGIAFYDDCF